jgi:hypothetical protein
MRQTITIRLDKDLAAWLENTAAKCGVSQGKLVRDQLEKARTNNGTQAFMHARIRRNAQFLFFNFCRRRERRSFEFPTSGITCMWEIWGLARTLAYINFLIFRSAIRRAKRAAIVSEFHFRDLSKLLIQDAPTSSRAERRALPSAWGLAVA